MRDVVFALCLGALAAAGCAATEAFDSPLDPNNPNCPDPSAALPAGYRLIDKVSDGTVVELSAGTIHVDAQAGGFANAADNPFVYLSFESGSPKKVEISDLDAFASTEWDIAFKRIVVRANGGDSGPGGARVASTPALEVSSAQPPEASQFLEDDYANDSCELVSGQIGEPITAFGAWYEYDFENNRAKTSDRVFFVQRGSRVIRLDFESYYGLDEAGDSANYIIHWAID